MERFTHNKIANLNTEKKRYHITEGNGFCLRVSPKGTKTWFYRYKFDGKEKWLTIGNFPSMSAAEARKAFNELWEIRQSGKDPEKIIEKKLLEKNNTLQTLVSEWYTNYIERHRKQPLQIKQHLDADIIPVLGKMELKSIEARDITRELDKIVLRGSPVHANKVLSTLKQVFNYAVSRGELTVNPVIGIRARDIGGLEKPRERYLSIEEIQKVWWFLDSDQHAMSLQIIIALKIILLTGVRTGEIRLAKWKELDFANALWTIPAEHTKTGIVMHIHLTQTVKLLFIELQNCSFGEFIISGADGIKPLSDKALPHAVRRIQKRIDIPQWTAHDLRRTFATQLGETLQIDPVVVEKCLGHKMPKIMATYNKNEMLPQRKEALEQWEKFINHLVIKKEYPVLEIESQHSVLA